MQIAVSIFVGILLAGAITVFIDGVITAPDAFPWGHGLTFFVSFISMVGLNVVSPHRIEESGATKIWFFFWTILGISMILHAMYIAAVEYPPDHNWPGVSLVVATTMIFGSGAINIFERIENERINYF